MSALKCAVLRRSTFCRDTKICSIDFNWHLSILRDADDVTAFSFHSWLIGVNTTEVQNTDIFKFL